MLRLPCILIISISLSLFVIVHIDSDVLATVLSLGGHEVVVRRDVAATCRVASVVAARPGTVASLWHAPVIRPVAVRRAGVAATRAALLWSGQAVGAWVNPAWLLRVVRVRGALRGGRPAVGAPARATVGRGGRGRRGRAGVHGGHGGLVGARLPLGVIGGCVGVEGLVGVVGVLAVGGAVVAPRRLGDELVLENHKNKLVYWK